MNIFSSKTIVCTDPNRRSRFISETESSESFLTGFIGSTGAFLKGQGDFLGEQGGRNKLEFIFYSDSDSKRRWKRANSTPSRFFSRPAFFPSVADSKEVETRKFNPVPLLAY